MLFGWAKAPGAGWYWEPGINAGLFIFSTQLLVFSLLCAGIYFVLSSFSLSFLLSVKKIKAIR
jgi:hypothetical protein